MKTNLFIFLDIAPTLIEPQYPGTLLRFQKIYHVVRAIWNKMLADGFIFYVDLIFSAAKI